MTEEQKVEQITKEPEEKVEKIKDPKKVAAGKRLAASNKKARMEAANKSSADDEDSSGGGWFPSLDNLNFANAVALISVGLAGAHLYLDYRKSAPATVVKKQTPTPVVETKKEEPTTASTSFME